jgi:inorganic pyrophosphatase
MRAKPIGVMKMMDQGEEDDKIIAVHLDDPEYAFYDSISQLPPHRMSEVQRFFEDYKSLENKTVSIEGILDRAAALATIVRAIKSYKVAYPLHPPMP